MTDRQRFEIILDPDAYKEYTKLDNTVVILVDKVLAELEIRADEIGKPLQNKGHAKLAGCKEIKLRDAGIRIVFRITDKRVDILRIVYILAIEKRSHDSVFKAAHKRYKALKRITESSLLEFLKKQIKWKKQKK